MATSPMSMVKEKFGSKDKLVDKLAGQVEPLEGETKDDLRTRLSSTSNRKLLRLLDAEEKVQELFGSKDKLVAEVLRLLRPGAKKADDDYQQALAKKSKAELLMMHAAASRKTQGAAAPETAPAPKAKAVSKARSTAKPKKKASS